MSIIENILNGLSGSDDNSSENSNFTPPTSLCRSDCGIAPGACSMCSPYKEKLIDALYNVEHIDEYQAKYEVSSEGSQSDGTVKCPYCGANSADPHICEYCGSKLNDGTSKIKVASAADIPDPVIEARDIIYDRHAAIAEKYKSEDDNSSLSGILSGIAGIFTGAVSDDSSDNETESLGTRMSRDEIEQMAASYGVSLSTYLKGLDNGTYMTMNQKKNAQNSENRSSGMGSSLAGAAAGLGGIGTVLGAASMLGNSRQNSNYGRPPMNNNMGGPGQMGGQRGGFGGPGGMGGQRGGFGGPGGPGGPGGMRGPGGMGGPGNGGRR